MEPNRMHGKRPEVSPASESKRSLQGGPEGAARVADSGDLHIAAPHIREPARSAGDVPDARDGDLPPRGPADAEVRGPLQSGAVAKDAEEDGAVRRAHGRGAGPVAQPGEAGGACG